MQVIDMECNVPKATAEDNSTTAASVQDRAAQPAGYGMANYARIFRSRSDGGDARPKTAISEYVATLERAGIVSGVPFGLSNDEVAVLLQDYPDRFIGLARISAFDGMRGVRELELRVRDQGFKALGV